MRQNASLTKTTTGPDGSKLCRSDYHTIVDLLDRERHQPRGFAPADAAP
jgi:hypothetical protein